MEPTKWCYNRDEITDLSKLAERGTLGWELVTILNTEQVKTAENQTNQSSEPVASLV